MRCAIAVISLKEAILTGDFRTMIRSYTLMCWGKTQLAEIRHPIIFGLEITRDQEQHLLRTASSGFQTG